MPTAYSDNTTILNVALKLSCATRDRSDTTGSVNRRHVFADCWGRREGIESKRRYRRKWRRRREEDTDETSNDRSYLNPF